MRARVSKFVVSLALGALLLAALNGAASANPTVSSGTVAMLKAAPAM